MPKRILATPELERAQADFVKAIVLSMAGLDRRAAAPHLERLFGGIWRRLERTTKRLPHARRDRAGSARAAPRSGDDEVDFVSSDFVLHRRPRQQES